MIFRLFVFNLCYVISFLGFGQNKIDLKADFDITQKQIKIAQTISYKNTSQKVLNTIYLNNWANSFANKKTPLAIRISDEFNKNFHLANKSERGYSKVESITQNATNLTFQPLKDHIDVLEVQLSKPVNPNDFYTITLEYIVQVPSDKFTKYGLTDSGDLNLRYWYITPVMYGDNWKYYSNMDLDDMYVPKSEINMEVKFPSNYTLTSELDLIETIQNKENLIVKLHGENRINTKLFLNKQSTFNAIQNDYLTLVSNLNDVDVAVLNNVLITEKITNFLNTNFGNYPHKKLLISQIDYEKNPIYGLNFLPKFIKPYPKHFQYELKLLKIVLKNYLENTLLINPRTEQWLLDGIHIFYLMNYVNEFYPNMKFFGKISNFWGVRSFHASDMMFNDKYILGHMLMARTNRDQPLTMPKDSLLKFNHNIANKYKAGIGLNYLNDFVGENILKASIEDFVRQNKLKPISTYDFEIFLKSRINKDINWFFKDYIRTRKKIDFKIKKVLKTKDSITLTVKNKRNNSMPVSLYSLHKDNLISKYWIENIDKTKTITIPRLGANKLVLNYNKIIPEFNLRDNWKSLKGLFFNNKPLQFRFFQDIEDPNYNQVFFMPVLEFNNIYDGITLGIRTYNKTLLRKRLNYKIEPKYSLKSRSLTGSALISMNHYLENKNLYSIRYGIGASYSSYAEDLFVRKFTPSLRFLFRDDNDFRSNKRESILLRYIYINRDADANNLNTSSDPNYGVLNARYVHSNDNLINFNKWYTNFELAENFSKVSFNYEFRRLFENNRQLNIRLFSGLFLKNDNPINSNYFSFALDRPTDYLFDYAYLGRSEDSGIFSQQFIEAEGGFKSKLESPYANQWMTTLNVSTTLWNYILAYGDIGLVKNKFNIPNLVYNSGVRVNLVTDYFEVYFPIYSNLGWEIGQKNYDQKIRFKFTVDPQVLLGLFRRKWF